MSEDKTQIQFKESTKYKLLKFFQRCALSQAQLDQVKEVCESVLKDQQDKFKEEIRKDLKDLTKSLIELQTTVRLNIRFLGGFAIIVIPSLVTLIVAVLTK